jgi:uncharacterized protein GlcG (DUF336 family)
MPLTLTQADAVVHAARKKAQGLGIAACIVVLDDAGHLKSLSRMDGSWLGAIDVAIRKAKSAALFECETQMLWDVCKPEAQAHGLELTNGGLVTFAGGIPLRAAQGSVVGSVGISGGEVAQDYEIAQAGAAAMNV